MKIKADLVLEARNGRPGPRTNWPSRPVSICGQSSASRARRRPRFSRRRPSRRRWTSTSTTSTIGAPYAPRTGNTGSSRRRISGTPTGAGQGRSRRLGIGIGDRHVQHADDQSGLYGVPQTSSDEVTDRLIPVTGRPCASAAHGDVHPGDDGTRCRPSVMGPCPDPIVTPAAANCRHTSKFSSLLKAPAVFRCSLLHT